MAAHLLDSSAIVNRFVNEAGSAWVAGLVDPSAGSVDQSLGLLS